MTFVQWLMDLFKNPNPALLKQLGEQARKIEVLEALLVERQEEIEILMEKLAETKKVGVFLRGGLTGNIPSPRVPILESDIVYYPSTETLIIKNLPGVTISTVQNTNSMEPLLDIGHITINSDAPKYMDTIGIGSVVTADIGSGQRIIHRIVEEAEYEGKKVYGTQGDNLNKPDPYTVYPEQIESVLLFTIPAEKFYSYIPEEGD